MAEWNQCPELSLYCSFYLTEPHPWLISRAWLPLLIASCGNFLAYVLESVATEGYSDLSNTIYLNKGLKESLRWKNCLVLKWLSIQIFQCKPLTNQHVITNCSHLSRISEITPFERYTWDYQLPHVFTLHLEILWNCWCILFW